MIPSTLIDRRYSATDGVTVLLHLAIACVLTFHTRDAHLAFQKYDWGRVVYHTLYGWYPSAGRNAALGLLYASFRVRSCIGF